MFFYMNKNKTEDNDEQKATGTLSFLIRNIDQLFHYLYFVLLSEKKKVVGFFARMS